MNESSSLLYDRAILIAHVADLNEDEVLAIVKKCMAEGYDPLAIIEDCQEGLRQVGERYEQQQYFLSGLIMGGEIFREVMELIQPVIKKNFVSAYTGTILLGTVRGDIHNIGKNNLSMLLTCYGFSVHDLGVDVPPAEFLAQTKRIRPDIVGLSGLLTSSYDAMKETIDLLRGSDELKTVRIPIIIGGNQLNEQVCQYVGADYWVNDAMAGVRLCQGLLANTSDLDN